MKEENSDLNNALIEQMKKQWAAMGLDPNQMLSYMNNSLAMQKNMHEQMQQALGSNPLLKNILGMANGQAPAGDMLNMFDESPEVKEDSDLSEEERKAVLCGANLSYYNTQYINTLSTFRPVDEILEGLEAAWGVTSREDLLKTLDWLEQDGHKIYFDLIWAKLSTLPKPEWRAGIKSLQMQAMANPKIEADRLFAYASNILKGYPALLNQGCFATMKNPNIAAWDYARAINLCRFGFDVEFLTRQEALDKIQRYAKHMYSIYDSWKSLSEGYLVGFSMWSDDEDDLEERLEQHHTLLTHEKSLWTKITW